MITASVVAGVQMSHVPVRALAECAPRQGRATQPLPRLRQVLPGELLTHSLTHFDSYTHGQSFTSSFGYALICYLRIRLITYPVTNRSRGHSFTHVVYHRTDRSLPDSFKHFNYEFKRLFISYALFNYPVSNMYFDHSLIQSIILLNI